MKTAGVLPSPGYNERAAIRPSPLGARPVMTKRIAALVLFLAACGPGSAAAPVWRDGTTWVTSGKYGGDVRIWDFESGRLRQTFPRAKSVSLSPDGKLLVLCEIRNLEVIRLDTGKKLVSRPYEGSWPLLTFAGDDT